MKLLFDTWLIFRRSLQSTLRNPAFMIFGMFQPLCFLLLFAPFLQKLVGVQGFGEGSYLLTYIPGLLVLMAMYSTGFVGFGLIDDIRSGVIDRFKVTPINRRALLLGRSLRDMTILALQVTFLLICAWILNLSVPLIGILLSYKLVLLIGFIFSALSYSAALILQSEGALAPVTNFFLLPLQLLAGITLPLALAPVWLQKVAFLNPLSHAVIAARELFLGNYVNSAVLWGFGSILCSALIVYHVASSLFIQAER